MVWNLDLLLIHNLPLGNRRSTLRSNPFTDAQKSILFHRLKNGMNNLCTSPDAMLRNTRKLTSYKQGENGITDSLQTLIEDWNDFQSQKQFRDILHYKLPHREV